MMARLLVLACLAMFAGGCGPLIRQTSWRGDPVRRLVRNQLDGRGVLEPQLSLGPEIHFPAAAAKRFYLHLEADFPFVDSESELVLEVDGERHSLPVDTALWTDEGLGMHHEARFETSESFLTTMAGAREIVVFVEGYRQFFGPEDLEHFSEFVLSHLDGTLPPRG